MLSILGATLDDMEEILKGLGYRADAVKAEEAAAYLSTQDASSAVAAPAVGGDSPGSSDETPMREGSGRDAGSSSASTEAAPADVTADCRSANTGRRLKTLPRKKAPAVDVTDEAKSEAGEPKPVLLWRLGGGRENNQRQRRSQGDRRVAASNNAQATGSVRAQGVVMTVATRRRAP
jgi:ATP-dependent RNA helicase SUPV3L1/SUV3